MSRQLRAGVSRIDITPPLGIAHAAWGAQTHERATGVDLPLWATALALSDGRETVVIIDLDIIYIWEAEAPAVFAAVEALTGLARSHIRISYTHTHSGPVNGKSWTTWIKQGTEMVAAYDASLPHRIAGVAWAAIQNLRPARIAGGSGHCAIAVNRRMQRPGDNAVVVGRNWDGPVDHQVQLLRIDGIDGEPLAAIVNYACHPITVGPDNTLITPDYPGVVKRVVEDATGATCLFLQGATGNIGPIHGVARGGLQEYKRLGAILGHEAAKVWWQLEPRPRQARYMGTLESGAPLADYLEEYIDEPDRTLRVATRAMHLPLRQLPDPDLLEAQLAGHVAQLQHLRDTGGNADEIRKETMLSKRTGMRAQLARELQEKSHLTFEAQAFTIGSDIAISCMPGEPFVQIGMGVKDRSPFKYTLFSGYSNIGWAYIPMPEDYPLGGYEVEITPFSPDASLQIIEEQLALLHQLAAELG
jgi:hypothetical protein